MAEFFPQTPKSIINKKKSIDSWFWDRYSINPYNGCQFGCIYCDARSARYHMPEDFENKIVVKEGAAELLDKRLKNARTFLQDVVGIGGVTDCYQPAERQFRNTRKILEVLNKYRFPVHIVTKSKLVLEDLELLNEIGKNSWCTVSISISVLDQEKARFLDKYAPSPEIRLKTLQTIRDKAPNVQAGVLMIPIVPVFGDSAEELEGLATAAKNAGAQYLLFGGGMTMRDTQALWFLKNLKKKFPELISKYEELFRFKYDPAQYRGRHTPDPSWTVPVNLALMKICKEISMPNRIPRFIPNDFRKINYQLSEKLLNHAYELQFTGKSWENWFWAGQNIQMLGESVAAVAREGRLADIRNVKGEVLEFVNGFLGFSQSAHSLGS